VDRVSQRDDRFASKGRVAITWLTLLPASSAGLIVCRVVLHQEPPPWLDVANLAVLLLLIAIASTGAAWRPLRGYFLALLAFAAGGMIADHIAATLVLGRVARMFANTSLELIACALLALTLVGSGLTRRDVFLAKGDMAAPARLPWGTTSWRRFGPVLTLAFAGGLAIQLTLTLHPDMHMLGRALVALPLAIAFSVVNAVQEEFRFRAVFLARLLPAVGMTHALFVSSLLFGLEHWYGHPGGPSGVVLAGFAGYMWARSMVETRGSAWAWLIHGFQDVVIFSFLIMANG
jgi:membrane protease YdiL (CAAX protease family)